MKHIPSFTICLLTFIAVPVEGTLFLLINSIFFSNRRETRDCKDLLSTTGIEDAESLCSCSSNLEGGKELTISCTSFDPMQDDVCLSPSDTTFCNSVSPTSVIVYTAYSTPRRALELFTSPSIVRQDVQIDIILNGEINTFQVTFFSDGGLPTPKAYNRCGIRSLTADCASCEICESGVDVKYDCSNANVAFTFNDVTNMTESIPGPKVESCIPIADIVPPF